MIELNEIKKSYDQRLVIDIKSMTIGKNQIYGLIGPNGAGKSTTMKMLLGLVQPDSGTITIDGKEMNAANRRSILQEIGSLIEGPSYYPHLSGAQNMDIVCALKKRPTQAGKEALAMVGLQNQATKKVKEYSLGMKQRLGIAMALAGKPQLLILDEPTNGLDPVGMDDIRQLILQLAKDGTTIMISSHMLDELEKMIDHLAIIHKGAVYFEGSLKAFKHQVPPTILLDTADNRTAMQLLQISDAQQCDRGFYLGDVSTATIYDAVTLLTRHGIGVHRIEESRKSLESLFIDLGLTERRHVQ